MERDAITFNPVDDPADLAVKLQRDLAADIVERLNRLPVENAAKVIGYLPVDRAVEVVDQPGLDAAAALIEAQPIERATVILNGMSADRRADVFRHLDRSSRDRFLPRLDPEARTTLQKLLTYPTDTAGSIMTTEFVSVPVVWTVGAVLEHIRKVERTRETVYAIYLLDPNTQKLVGAVSLRRLIAGNPEAVVSDVALPRTPIKVTPLTDREEVARLISKYDLLAVPVVDADDRLLGIVTVDDVIDAMVEETTEDVQKFGGMAALDEPYAQIGFGLMIRKRAGWLSVLFLSEMLTASAMQYFNTELEKAIVLTLFIPLIMSSGGNSGSQATSLIIRALALRELQLADWWRVVIRELPTGMVLGSILGVIGLLRIALWQQTGIYDYGPYWILIALTVASTLVGIVTFGSVAGSMLPFILKRLGFDPASASAPFVATLVDVSGLVIYFTVALLWLRGTLL